MIYCYARDFNLHLISPRVVVCMLYINVTALKFRCNVFILMARGMKQFYSEMQWLVQPGNEQRTNTQTVSLWNLARNCRKTRVTMHAIEFCSFRWYLRRAQSAERSSDPFVCRRILFNSCRTLFFSPLLTHQPWPNFLRQKMKNRECADPQLGTQTLLAELGYQHRWSGSREVTARSHPACAPSVCARQPLSKEQRKVLFEFSVLEVSHYILWDLLNLNEFTYLL